MSVEWAGVWSGLECGVGGSVEWAGVWSGCVIKTYAMFPVIPAGTKAGPQSQPKSDCVLRTKFLLEKLKYSPVCASACAKRGI